MTTEKSSGGWDRPWQGEFTKIPGEESDLGPLVRQEVPGDISLPEQGQWGHLFLRSCRQGRGPRTEPGLLRKRRDFCSHRRLSVGPCGPATVTLGWTVGKAPLVGSRTGSTNLPSPSGGNRPVSGCLELWGRNSPKGVCYSVKGREKETSGFYFRFPP